LGRLLDQEDAKNFSEGDRNFYGKALMPKIEKFNELYEPISKVVNPPQRMSPDFSQNASFAITSYFYETTTIHVAIINGRMKINAKL
jgi:hypothetical protein